MQELLFPADKAAGPRAQEGCVSPADAERGVKGLRVFALEEVGTPAWLDQHDWVEKLNLQAHLNAQSHSDEFVKEALVSLDRVTTLVQELLVTEVWKEKVLPALRQHLAQEVDSVTSYQLLYHEAALANLLELLLYHRDACESLAEDALLELCDWCCRKLLYLATDAHEHAKYTEVSVHEMMNQSPMEELEAKEREISFSTALCGLTILRYLTDHMDKVSLGLMARLATTNDAAMALLPLVDHPPWVRRGKSGMEKFINGKWQAVEARDRLVLTRQDGQVWLALYNLVVDPGCRAKLGLTDSRCDALFKLKRHFSEPLLDQLPVLKDLQRVIDELAFGVGAAGPQPGTAGPLIVEQVPMIRATLLRRSDWAELAQDAQREQFGAASRKLSQQRIESMLRTFDLMSSMDEDEGGLQGARGLPTSFKLEAYRAVKQGVWEWWATYNLEISPDKSPEPVSTAAVPAAASSAANGRDENQPQQPHSSHGSASQASGAAGAGEGQKGCASGGLVKGLRYRLVPLSPNLQRAFPSQGKLAVVVAGRSCQASLELPASETRDTSALPAAVWLTVGSLAGDGMALQLKLKRLDKPSERDKVLGVWYPYVPVAGALSVRDGFLN